MANNIDAYCPVCKQETLHFADTEGWLCDNCDRYNDTVFASPYPDRD